MLGSNFIRRMFAALMSTDSGPRLGTERLYRSNRFLPLLEDLEGRTVPAGGAGGTTWDWTPPQRDSTDGNTAANWTQDGGTAHGVPAAGDTIIFSTTFTNGQNSCVLAPATAGVVAQVKDTYAGTISSSGNGNLSLTSVTVALTATPTFDMGGKSWDFGNGSQLGGTVQNGTLLVSSLETQTWTTLTVGASVTNQFGGTVNVANSVSYKPGNNKWVFDNEGSMTFGASSSYTSVSMAQGANTVWFEPILNGNSATLNMTNGTVNIGAWIDNFGRVNIGSKTQSSAVTIGGYDPVNSAGIVGEASSTTYMAAQANQETDLTANLNKNAIIETAGGRLTIDGAGNSMIFGNLSLIGNQTSTANLYFNGTGASDNLTVTGSITLDYSSVDVNLLYPPQGQQGVSVNQIACNRLTLKDTNTFGVFSSGGPAVAFNNLATIRSNAAPQGNAFTFSLPAGVAANWVGGTLNLSHA